MKAKSGKAYVTIQMTHKQYDEMKRILNNGLSHASKKTMEKDYNLVSRIETVVAKAKESESGNITFVRE